MSKKLGSSFRKKQPIPSLEEAFRTFDKDGSGSLSVVELQAVLTRPGGGAALSEEEVAEIIAEFDTNNDGELQFEEFAALFTSSQGVAPSMPSPAPSSTSVLTRAISKDGLHTIRPKFKESSRADASKASATPDPEPPVSGSDVNGSEVAPVPKRGSSLSASFRKRTSQLSGSFRRRAPPTGMPPREVAAREAAARAAAARAKLAAKAAAKPTSRVLTNARLSPHGTPQGTPHGTPRAGDGTGKGAGRAGEANKGKEQLPLLTAVELTSMAKEEQASAEMLAQIIAQEGSFERRLGAALQANENAAKATKGTAGAKQAISDLLRAWDSNRDGQLQKIEFRQAVRGSLKMDARNDEIDRVFDKFDEDKGGTLDIQELRPALMALQHAAATADGEKDEMATREKSHRKLVTQCGEAIETVRMIDTETERSNKLRSAEHAPLELRVAMMMVRRGKKPEEMAMKFSGVTQQGLGKEAKLFANKKCFRQGLLEMKIDGPPATGPEADAWFDALLVQNVEVERERESGAAAPATEPAGAARLAATTTKKGEAPTVELISTLRRAREAASKAQDDDAVLQKGIKAMQKTARAQQAIILAARESHAKAALDAEERDRKAKEKARAEEEAAKVKAAEAKKVKLAKKAEEKAAFDAKVAEKRESMAAVKV